MEITDLIAPYRVIIDLQASTKTQLLAELARRAATATGLPQKQIGDALQARETLGSTGVGAGIAIPHAQITELDGFYGLFVRLRRPIDYDAIDGHPVDLMFLLPSEFEGAPTGARLRSPPTAGSEGGGCWTAQGREGS